jgi:hypothetical protein
VSVLEVFRAKPLAAPSRPFGNQTVVTVRPAVVEHRRSGKPSVAAPADFAGWLAGALRERGWTGHDPGHALAGDVLDILRGVPARHAAELVAITQQARPAIDATTRKEIGR